MAIPGLDIQCNWPGKVDLVVMAESSLVKKLLHKHNLLPKVLVKGENEYLSLLGKR